MRVTQSMLADNSLRHLSKGYDQLGKLQDQLSTGKKISRASEDPVVAMNGMRYRTQTVEVEQFQRNSNEVYNWMESTDEALDKSTQALQRVRELTTQAANDSYEEGQRSNIAKEVSQLFEHLVSMANTKSNNKYIFNGSNTTNQPVNEDSFQIDPDGLSTLNEQELLNHQIAYDGSVYHFSETDGNTAVFANENGDTMELTYDGTNEDSQIDSITHSNTEEVEDDLEKNDIVLSRNDAVSTNTGNVEIELLKGVNIPVNSKPQNVFNSALFGDMKRLEQALEDPDSDGEALTEFIDTIDTHLDNMVNERAEIGARLNRVEMIDDRLSNQEVIAERILSDNEDADMEKVMIDLMSQENVHRAALGAGARIIQPTLMDFLR
ncbi:flagellar hook-associated protein FlgL [Alteribacillus sp. YIM 98480]|uniref:flagellar hook-associated protein FlgL n=1 Tax=Alteribacillus sp. YIM 98480 TaxID=2606599 RepID=UPI00131BD3A6|nr:flagellar hook-associated protein FlgL [Alteribacillus sp. YIM 98480]